MPRMAAHVYAAHQAITLKLASRDGGISRAQLADELNVSRAIAAGLIEKSGLELDHKDGRTEFFKAPNGTTVETPETPAPKAKKASKPELPPEVKDAAVVESDAVSDEELQDTIIQLDEEIVDTRAALHEAATKAGKALGEWATQSALVDALRSRMAELAVQRMNASS